MMKILSAKANLSKLVQTNHCLRATCITLLDQKGLQARHIMSVSGHKSEASIQEYASIVREDHKYQMSHQIATTTGSSADSDIGIQPSNQSGNLYLTESIPD